MWQGKSMIPKPRLSTPHHSDRPSSTLSTPNSRTPSRNPARNPARTPSRILRPPSRVSEHATAVQTTATTPSSRSNPLMKRGDTLAEHVIATGIISSHNPRQTTYEEFSTYHFNRSKSFRSSQLSDDESELPAYEKRNKAFSTSSPLTTPTKQLTASHIPGAHLSSPSFAFATPDQMAGSREAYQTGSDDELVIDEELVTRTPAKHKNSEWLASFGIDISLLNLTGQDDDDENHDPIVTPSPDFREKNCEVDASHPRSKPITPHAFRRRCATDFYGYASARENHTGPPTRMRSTGKTRRASARISVRELDALKCNESIGVEAKRVANRDIPKGSDVFLTPIRATRRQREKNGTPVVLSEVRRSLRINTPSSRLVPKDSVRGRIELLEANDHSYIPNPTLSDRAALSG